MTTPGMTSGEMRGEGLELTAVVEHPNRRSGHDAARFRIVGVKEHRLLLASACAVCAGRLP